MAKWESDTKRADGLYVQKMANEKWVIRFNGTVHTSCPCCGRMMMSARAARLVADQQFPQREAAT